MKVLNLVQYCCVICFICEFVFIFDNHIDMFTNNQRSKCFAALPVASASVKDFSALQEIVTNTAAEFDVTNEGMLNDALKPTRGNRDAKKDAWAAVLQKYQTETIICNSPLSYKGMQPCPLLPVNSSWPGFYTLEGSSGGWEPWREYR